jgi:hypothetical protein
VAWWTWSGAFSSTSLPVIPPPHSAQGRKNQTVRLNYSNIETDRWFETGVFKTRNTDKFAWTDVSAEVWVYTVPGHNTPKFHCPSASTVPAGQILAVPFRDCAKPLPADVEYAAFGSLHVETNEGFIGQAFEPGILILRRQPERRPLP